MINLTLFKNKNSFLKAIFSSLIILNIPNIFAKSNGPDVFGYYNFDQENGCGYDFHDISATGIVIINNGDDIQTTQSLSISAFKLYGTDVSQIDVNSNGYLSTDIGGPSFDRTNDCPLPNTPSTGTGNRINVLHDDLVTTVYFQHYIICPRVNDVQGPSAACDIFQWNGAQKNTSDAVVAQAILYEGSNEIALQYQTVAQSGKSSTTGMQTNNSLDGHIYACSTLNSIVGGSTAICMLPPTAMSTCNNADTIISNERYSPFSNFTCNAASSITSDSTNGIIVEPNAIVNLRAPTVTINPPFRVRKGGQLSIGSVSSTCSSIDTDGDRLNDCVETGTGIYVDENNTGTSPTLADTDGDAINDGDEVLGTLAGLDLPAMGSNPLRKNIFIEYDWFDDSQDCAAHSHRPAAAMIRMVEEAFARAPVDNPDGTRGITIIQDYGQGGVFNEGNLAVDADGLLVGGVNSSEFISHKTVNFDIAKRQGYFHYTLMPHRYNTTSNSSGQAEILGNDLIVSLQCSTRVKSYAHTIMHELGHNLNLRHGGFENTNYKPNYNSIMNYKYQFPGVDGDCTPDATTNRDDPLNYSTGSNITLDESNLDENLGTCGHTASKDWNNNGVIETTVSGVDINQDSNATGIHYDYNDWANILFHGLTSSADGNSLNPPEIISCNNPAPISLINDTK